MDQAVTGDLLSFFFFRQKTAYEIQGDWSSDVCSSDLFDRLFDLYFLDLEALGQGLQKALGPADPRVQDRSEEHTSELQSPCNLVCRLLLEKKKTLHLVKPLPIDR